MSCAFTHAGFEVGGNLISCSVLCLLDRSEASLEAHGLHLYVLL